jgi:hypothetical protein
MGGFTLVVDEVDFIDCRHAPCFSRCFHDILTPVAGNSASGGCQHVGPFANVGFVVPGIRVVVKGRDARIRCTQGAIGSASDAGEMD